MSLKDLEFKIKETLGWESCPACGEFVKFHMDKDKGFYRKECPVCKTETYIKVSELKHTLMG